MHKESYSGGAQNTTEKLSVKAFRAQDSAIHALSSSPESQSLPILKQPMWTA